MWWTPWLWSLRFIAARKYQGAQSRSAVGQRPEFRRRGAMARRRLVRRRDAQQRGLPERQCQEIDADGQPGRLGRQQLAVRPAVVDLGREPGGHGQRREAAARDRWCTKVCIVCLLCRALAVASVSARSVLSRLALRFVSTGS